METSALTSEGISDLLRLIVTSATDPAFKLVGIPPRIPPKPTCPVDLTQCVSTSSVNEARENIHKMHLKHDFSDIKILVEDTKLPAHKILLAAGSPFFHDLLIEKAAKKSGRNRFNQVSRKDKILLEQECGRYAATCCFFPETSCVCSFAGAESVVNSVNTVMYNTQTGALTRQGTTLLPLSLPSTETSPHASPFPEPKQLIDFVNL